MFAVGYISGYKESGFTHKPRELIFQAAIHKQRLWLVPAGIVANEGQRASNAFQETRLPTGVKQFPIEHQQSFPFLNYSYFYVYGCFTWMYVCASHVFLYPQRPGEGVSWSLWGCNYSYNLYCACWESNPDLLKSCQCS